MAKRSTLFISISILWLPLSMLFDGLNTLILPAYLLKFNMQNNQASLLGLMTFMGLLLGMFVQTIAATYSDRLRESWGRKGMISLGLLLLIPLILLFEFMPNVFLLFLVFLLIQAAANIIQAALQGFIPDLVKPAERGMAAGIKNLMDIGGAMLVFVLLAQLFSEGKSYMVSLIIVAIFLLSYFLILIFIREPSQDVSRPLERPNLRAIFQLDFNKHRAFVWLIVSRFLFLLGTYAVGRFLLFFVAERLDLEANSAGEQTASILAILTLITVVAAPFAGWLADKISRRWLMIFGGLISALGVMLLMTAYNSTQMLLFGSLMALGSAGFSAANWALSADFAPVNEGARFLALANFGTAGAAAAAGIFGLVIDFGNQFGNGTGYNLLFIAAATAFLASSLAVQRIEAPQAVSDALNQSWAEQAHKQ